VNARRFLDTNVLLYSISRAPDEASKRARAIELLDDAGCCLSVQVLQEFYVQATRASRPDALPHGVAAGLVHAWLRFEIQDNTVALLSAALEIKAQHGFSYWDSAIIAAARALGCPQLYTEDLSHGRVIDHVSIINPFL
jgi:predicted nucleic acid-binding protein